MSDKPANPSHPSLPDNTTENNPVSGWRRPFTLDRVVRLIIVLGLCLGALWLTRRLSSVLLPFFVAWLGAYLLEPLVQRNRSLLGIKGRFPAIVITLFEVVMLLAVLCIVFLPSIFNEMRQVAWLIRQYLASSGNTTILPEWVHDFLRRNVDFNSIASIMSNFEIPAVLDFIGNFISGGVDMLLELANWLLAILYLVFIMLDYERLLTGFRHMVPPRYRSAVFGIANDIKLSMNHYFRGQSLVALLVGVLFSIGFLIIGLPLAVVLGLFIGLLNMVPYLQLISIPITTMLCIVYSMDSEAGFWVIWWESMAVYIVVQCIQDLILTPRIMGKAMGLNPAIILLSLSVWGSLLGFIGLIIALPLTTLLLAYYNRYIIRRDESPDEKADDLQAIRGIEFPDEK